ncbi:MULTISPECIES: Cys-tRNA(Pro) deacylase [unclassified Pseudoalteromonas]|uniref:Cys-tRNA(Pro) deacylase n=1 Tax=unclassified Pseudoalteromonas TaxID=194690 RepID=UPI000C0795AF|nr:MULTISPECIES: Cys-tRNA(Pro) deacylase [unclassified Pseudoalteromonas]MDP2636765.1 Cys-tRNA(Pro) deacylase [Pseudoalteromonas sp. 1_MG-2023]PHN88548.1 Cys-tRNA(Pro) deacylase [Pseudoalteromonas sp. 3D05]
MTPAITLLEQKRINFTVLSYEHDSTAAQFGLEAVEKLALNAEQVFKTLVLETSDNKLVVAITPVSQQVNLKQLAKACGAKKAAMAEPNKVAASTGYILGGVSPLGQKKRLETYIHQSAEKYNTIYVSAGKRGLEIALCPMDLQTLTQASFACF